MTSAVTTEPAGATEPAEAAEPPFALDESPTAIARRARHLHVFLLIVSAIVVALAATMSIHQSTEVRLPGLSWSVPELCYFRSGTGLDCPGCGLTRSFIALAHGQLTLAWAFNPAGVLFFPVVLFQIPYRVAQLLRVQRGERSWNLGWLAQAVFAGLFLVLIVQWLGKILSLW